MKSHTPIILLLALVAGFAAFSSFRRGADSGGAGRTVGVCCPLATALEMKPMLPPTDSATSESSVETTRLHVIAYYFHGTVRCDTCLLIENLAKAVIEEQFKADMDARRLTFLPVNYDLPENAHFLKTYSLPCPSLVLVRQTDGQDAGWKLLGDVWQLVHEPPELNRYVAAEVQAFLSGEEQQTGSAPPQPPSAAEQR